MACSRQRAAMTARKHRSSIAHFADFAPPCTTSPRLGGKRNTLVQNHGRTCAGKLAPIYAAPDPSCLPSVLAGVLHPRLSKFPTPQQALTPSRQLRVLEFKRRVQKLLLRARDVKNPLKTHFLNSGATKCPLKSKAACSNAHNAA